MLFLSVVCAVIYGGGWYPEGVFWQVMAKASGIGFLALFVLVTSQTSNHLILLLALLLSLAGDVLLAIPAEASFLRGLSAFLAAHIIYTILFLKNRLTYGNTSGLRIRISALLWIAVGLVMFLTYPKLGEMLIPVAVYSVVLTLMATTALMSRFPIKMLGLGAILFIISDSFLGAETFLNFTLGSPYIVWTTYYLAQLFITLSVMLYDDRRTHFGGYRFD
jgi:uncharacterized membrane protein YhhN